MIQQERHIFRGIQRDLSVSKFSAEFAYDAYNIRLTARDNNTLLSATNEKGTLEIPIEWEDRNIININEYNILGYTVLNEYLVLFIQYIELEIYHDAIVRLKLNDTKDKFNGVVLFDQAGDKNTGALNFNIKNPIESLAIYEGENVQKVYWVDGLNPNRMINIASITNTNNYNQYSFDFLQKLQLEEKITIKQDENINGQFPIGVTQYAFTYYNLYGSESNIIYVSPLYYNHMIDRGGSPEEKAIGGYNIIIDNIDNSFDYLRCYSITRTSENATPIVKKVQDINIKNRVYSYPIKDVLTETSNTYYYQRVISTILTIYDIFLNKVSLNTLDYTITSSSGGYEKHFKIPKDYIIEIKENNNTIKAIAGDSTVIKEIHKSLGIGSGTLTIHDYYTSNNTIDKIIPINIIDNNTQGEIMDSTLLLYIGGKDIISYTMTQKDNTLFLGNLKTNKNYLTNDEIEDIKNNSSVSFEYRDVDIKTNDTLYPYNIQLDKPSSEIKHFKGGEVYRIGVQFKTNKGEYIEPINLGNFKNTLYPYDNKRPCVKASIKCPKGYKSARLVMAKRQNQDKSIICQGILCPTVFNAYDRYDNSPFVQSSWFTRPFSPSNSPININAFNYTAIHKELQIDSTDDDQNIYIKDSNISSKTYSLEYRRLLNQYQTYGIWLYDENSKEIYRDKDDKYEVIKDGLKQFIEEEDIPLETDFTSELKKKSVKPLGLPENNSIINSIQHKYYVDTSIVTMHSPDINLNQNIINNAKLRIIGYIDLYSVLSDYNVDSNIGRANNSQTVLNNYSGRYKAGFFNMKPIYYDKIKDTDKYTRYFIYPWQRNGSLNSDGAIENRTALLKKKIISNLQYYNNTILFDNPWEAYLDNSDNKTGITDVKLFNSDSISTVVLNSPKYSNYKDSLLTYYGNIDKIVIPSKEYLIKYAGDNLQDFSEDNYQILEEANTQTYDPISMRYKSNPHYIFAFNFTKTGLQRGLPLISNEDTHRGGVTNLPIWSIPLNFIKPNHIVESYSDLPTVHEEGLIGVTLKDKKVYTSILLASPSGSTYQWGDFNIKGKYFNVNGILYNLIGNGTNNLVRYQYSTIDLIKFNTPVNDYLLVGELYKDISEDSLYGGKSTLNNIWIPIGDDTIIDTSNNTLLVGTEGDTYYQRYDCLKTYAYTQEDQNQIIDIASFMVETSYNLDGRYDKNRNNINNLYINPTNFNLFNSVYNQDNNYFNYRILDDRFKQTNFPNTITWSKEKHILSDIDEWTNITMTSTLDLDGDKGQVTSLNTFNNEIFCFQEKGLSNILFNSRVQIPASDGVPIEITNGLKVQGKRYISNMVGCQNKWSIIETPSGLYFMDNNTSSIYQFNGQINSLTDKLGFKSWMNEVNNYSVWNPIDYSNFRSFYDRGNDDIYFINKDYCLCYSEYLQQFTSFMSYESVPLMVNIGSELYSFKKGKLWQNNAGEYNMFYNEFKPYSITFISNDNPSYDKIFNNLDFRADSYDNNTITNKTFDTLEVWNEYQKGVIKLNNIVGRPSNLKKKFRVWRVNIPRANTDWNGIVANNRDRIRNTWAYIKLSMNDNNNKLKTELHDVIVSYFM